MSQRTEFRTCPLCEAICGLEITATDSEVILPGESHLCQPHFSATLYQLAVRHVAKWSDPVFAPDPITLTPA